MMMLLVTCDMVVGHVITPLKTVHVWLADTMQAEQFWWRYLFRLHCLQEDERKGDAILAGVGDDEDDEEDLDWGADDDEDDEDYAAAAAAASPSAEVVASPAEDIAEKDATAPQAKEQADTQAEQPENLE